MSDENQTDLDEPNEVENTDDSYISLNVEKTSTNEQAGLYNIKECISITISGTDPVKVAQAARKVLEAWEGK